MKEIFESKVVSGDIELKVNNINKIIFENDIKFLIVKEFVMKLFMNGDVIMEDFNEKNNLEIKLCLLRFLDVESDYRDGLEILLLIIEFESV